MPLLRVIFLALLLTACSVPDKTPDDQFRLADPSAYSAALSSDAQLAIVSTEAEGILVWDLARRERLYQWQHQGEGNNLVESIHIAADKSYVVTSDREAFALWNLDSGEPEGFWRIDESNIRAIAVANQGRGILVARSSGQVMFFEPQTTRRLEFLGHTEKVNSIDISPNGRYALSGGNDYTAYLWDTESGQVVHRFDHPSRVTKVMLDDQGRYAFTADSKKHARIWDVQSGKEISRLQYTERQKIFSATTFSADGSTLLTGSPSRQLILWDVATGKEVAEWRVTPRGGDKLSSAVVHAVGFSSEGAYLSVSSNGLLELWR